MLVTAIIVLSVSYLLGSIPFGFLVVWVAKGKDIRQVASGRTGGTNAFRAAGLLAGLLTALFDMLKGTVTVFLAHEMAPGVVWLMVAAPIFAILGHNYSIYMIEHRREGLKLGGGAGGATCLGGAVGLWPPLFLIVLPLAGAIWYGIGYASVTTMSIALLSIIVFAIRASMGLSPWIYVLYGVIAEIILIWALRPNIKRLINGTERIVGWRARHHQQQIPK